MKARMDYGPWNIALYSKWFFLANQAWVKKQKAAAKAKELALKRAKMLEEMDDAFGVDDLIKKVCFFIHWKSEHFG